MATNSKELRSDLSRARHETLVWQWAGMALSMGEPTEKSIRVRNIDGESWRVRLVLFRSPAGNAQSVLFRTLGADSPTPDMTDDFLRWCDTEVSQCGRDYAAFDAMRREIRSLMAEFDEAAVSLA